MANPEPSLKLGKVSIARFQWMPFFRRVLRWIAKHLGVERVSLQGGLELSFVGAVVWGLGATFLVLALAIASIWIGQSSSSHQSEAEALRVECQQAQKRLAESHRIQMLLRAVHHLGGKRIPDAQAAEIAAVIDKNAKLYGFDPFLILAVVSVESRGHIDAVGQYMSGATSGATGMMQIMPATARMVAPQLGVKNITREDLFDPSLNLAVGTAILLKMIHRYNDLRLGIMAYNVGPNVLERALHGEGNLPTSYYAKVMNAYRRIRKQAENPG
jgi:soluble lytic murein transglycosylase-like protein